MPRKRMNKLFSRSGWMFLCLACVLSYFTYFHNYQFPPRLYWDEGYHITSAQKYLNGVRFLETHPPLGKMLIALGEKIVQANGENDQFLTMDRIGEVPEDFSFRGYRLIPALLGWLTAPLLFLVFLLILRNPLLAATLSFLYIFDNALIVHLRGAMLEGPLIFCTVTTILAYLLLLQHREHKWHFLLWSFLFGCAFAGAFATKLTGLILILLFPTALWQLWAHRQHCIRFLAAALLGFFVLSACIWSTHFALGNTVLPGNYYPTPAGAFVRATEDSSGISENVKLRSALRYMLVAGASAPPANLCKPTENGSPFFLWPLGGRSISYRWETANKETYRYLYLQANPIVWWISFLGVFLAVALVTASFLLPLRRKLQHRELLIVILILYAGYMIGISQIDRVMYLYHYFPPLLFSFILTGLVVSEIQHIGRWRLTTDRKTLGCLALAVAVFLSYQFYRPLTYYEPLTDAQVARRAIFPLWDLRCATCEQNGYIFKPIICPHCEEQDAPPSPEDAPTPAQAAP